MGNDVFDSVVAQLTFLGDILSIGIVKKGVAKMGTTPEGVTAEEMAQVVDNHIIPALRAFVS